MEELSENDKKLWKQMLFLWERLNVPAIKTRKFMVGRHVVRSPWFSIIDNTQVESDTKSLNRTAEHLVVDFAEGKTELIVAYKIYSFLKSYYGTVQPFTRILLLVMRKHGVYEGSLWFASAKNFLPYVNNDPYQFEQEIENKDWISAVLAAADTWIKIAEEWEIIIIPEYTKRDSEVNKQLETFRDLWDNNEDIRNFIQLRDKLKKTLEEDMYKILINIGSKTS